MKKFSDFGYKINYAEALAQDAAEIAMYADGGPVTVANKALAMLGIDTSRYESVDALSVLSFAATQSLESFLAVATVYEIDERDALAFVTEADHQGENHASVKSRSEAVFTGPYREVMQGCDRVSEGAWASVSCMNETRRKKALALAKAAKSRHTRNQEKYGR